MNSNNKEDTKKIEETLQNYTEAFRENNIEKLVKAFHPESMVYWFVPERGGLFTRVCYEWVRSFIRWEKEEFYSQFHAEIKHIDCYGSVGYARFKFIFKDDENPRDTTDYLTLLKFGDSWEIVNKSGYTEDISREVLQERLEGKSALPHNENNEIEKIEEVLRDYIDLFDNFDATKIEKVFHPKVRVNSVDAETHRFKNQYRPKVVWNQILDEHREKGIKFETKIESIDQTGTSAVVKMKWLALTPDGIFETMDYLTLLSFDGIWLIVNKSCHFREVIES